MHDGAMAASATDAARPTAKVVQGREEEMEREREDDLLSGGGLWLEGEKGPCSKSATP